MDCKVKTVSDADQALKEIAILEREITSAKLSAEAEIEATRKGLKRLVEPRLERIAARAAALEEWAREHSREWAPLKSLALVFGVIGFRQEKPGLRYPRDLGNLVARIKALKLNAYLRVVEEPNKDLLLDHRDKLPLDDLGLKLKKQRDVFYYETAQEKPDEVA